MNDYTAYIGKILDKRYKIQELVGVGGMACVLRAQDLLMNRTVAIKILNDEYNGNEQAEKRFMDESKAVAMLSHKNIVSIYDIAIYPDMKYIVMEYLDGITLREYLDNKEVLPWNEACIYILQVLRALEHAHSKGVIHRDIKPQNIILQKNGEIKVMDFGIAKIPTSASMQSDKAVGTVYYISPEQASGKETGAYSDLYSVGILLYEAVTGTLPFRASSPMAVAAMQVNDEPQNPRDLVLSIPVGVSQIILKAMMKNPESRFRSAHSMSKAIEWVLRNPEVIFSLTGDASSKIGDTSVVSIDMIDTAEIKPYGEDEIAQSLGKKPITDKEKEREKKKEAEEKKKQRAFEAKRRKRKMPRRSTSLFPIISGIFFPFLLVSIVLGIMLGVTFVKDLFFSEDSVPTAVYPNLIGKVYDDELNTALQNGRYGAQFVIDESVIEYKYNPNFKNGEIIYTEPSGNTRKKAEELQGTPVFRFTKVYINQIKTTEYMPDVVGFQRAEAQRKLTNEYGVAYKCIVFEVDEGVNYLENDQVSRTEPAAGEPYVPGNTITIYYCKQKEPIKTDAMPNCVGLSPAEAKTRCGYALYKNVRFEEKLTKNGDYTVTSQSVRAEKVSNKDVEVVLTVSKPDVRNLSLTDALAKLKTLNNVTVLYEDIYEVSQKPAAVASEDHTALVNRLLNDYRAVLTEEITSDTYVLFQDSPDEQLQNGQYILRLVCVTVKKTELYE